MRITLDPDTRIPLFEQIARAIQYEIAVGRLEPGAALPSVRDAAARLGVHYLTVRRAYAALRDEGLVTSRPGVGTRVAPGADAPDDGGGVCMVECNGPQATDYATQVSAALGRPVGTLLLDSGDEPPPGRIVGTYFHFNQIRALWPHRGADLRFVSVFIDPDLVSELARLAGDEADPFRVRLIETDASRAHNAVPDLRRLLPPERFEVEPEVVADLSAALADRRDLAPILLPPRLWQRAGEAGRADARVVLMRCLIAPPDLAALRAETDDADRAAAAGRRAS